MGTTIRPELSNKNRYWIDRHRYYELKHFCLQYPLWKSAYYAFDGMSAGAAYTTVSRSTTPGDPTAKCAIARLYYLDRMEMIERVAEDTDYSISKYLLKAVTEGVSYDYLKMKFNIPCSKDAYYDLYRKFFWLLSEERK